jgi:hypothetical protein
MDDKMKKLMEKKKDGKEIDPMHKEAKMSMLKELRDQMSGMMKDDLQNHGASMKKVEVAAPDAAGLAHGLDKAKELIGAADHASNDDQLGQDEADEHNVDSPDMYDVDPAMEESAEEGDSEEPEHEGEMDEKLSPEEEAHMHKLMARHSKHK